tara:strand:+ start:1938 stop:3008 length:1071 start_codon:yes stop_codon:yes gene_type:complete
MDKNLINDVRSEFKNITFSNFQKSKAKQELIQCIYTSKIENANYWAAELICAGHFLDLWDVILLYIAKCIHIGNPKLPIYLKMRFDNFVSIINTGYSAKILLARNNDKLRKLFAEIICILCFSTKKHNFQNVKLNKAEEFDLTNISNKFKAPNINYVESIFKDDDPKELFIPLNELIYNLSIKNIIEACFWYEWILEYENICKKKKKKSQCQGRIYAPNGHQNDIIWIIWDILFYYSDPTNDKNLLQGYSNKNKQVINKIIKSLYELFVIKYMPTFKKKRKFIIYFAFTLLIEQIKLDINITSQNEKVEAIVSKIDVIYRDIKKNEVSPNTDYLFANVKKTNIEKTIEKIELINNM